MNRVNTITGHLAPEYKTLETTPTVAGGTPTVGAISDDDVVICAAVHLCFHFNLGYVFYFFYKDRNIEKNDLLLIHHLIFVARVSSFFRN